MEFKLNDYHRNVSDEELLDDITRIANKLGKTTLLLTEYINNGGIYHISTICRRFGNWINALNRCGLSPEKSQLNKTGIPIEDLISDLQKVSTKINKKTFTASEYGQYGQYSQNVFFRKFGSWNNALSAAKLNHLTIR